MQNYKCKFFSTPPQFKKELFTVTAGVSSQMHHLPHRRVFVSKSSVPIANKFDINKDSSVEKDNEFFDALTSRIQNTRTLVSDPSIITSDASGANISNAGDVPQTRQRPQYPWYHLSPIQFLCLLILSLLLLFLIIFTMAVKRQRKKRLELTQKYGTHMKQKRSGKKQVNRRKEDTDHGLDVNLADVMITPMHTPTASVDKTSVKGDDNDEEGGKI